MILTPLDTPGPSVEVLVDSALTGTESITVWRTAAGRQHKVRGMINIPFLGAAARIDYDVPLGVVSEYRVECFDDGGERIGYTAAAQITVNSGSSWLHNPLAPDGAVQVSALDSSARELQRPSDSTLVYPIGRRVGVVVGSGRRGLSGFRFDVWTDSLSTADQIQSLIGDEGTKLPAVLCIRVAGPDATMRVPRPLYLHVPNIIEDDVTVNQGGGITRQLMEGDEAAPPALSLFIPLLRRMDLDAYYATRNDLDGSYLRRIDADRDYDLAGFADV